MSVILRTYTRYSGFTDKEPKQKVLGGSCLFKLSKGGDLIKELGKL